MKYLELDAETLPLVVMALEARIEGLRSLLSALTGHSSLATQRIWAQVVRLEDVLSAVNPLFSELK